MNTKKSPQQRPFSFASAALAAALLFCAAASPAQANPNGNASAPESEAASESEAEMLYLLLTIQANTQGTLNDLDSAVANASQDLSATGLNGTAAREVLTNLLDVNSNLIEASTISKEGRIIVSEGKGGGQGEGADISGQEHVTRILKTKIPTFSKQFLLLEGYNGTALIYPVFSPQGELLGGISAIIEPERLLNALIAPLLHLDIYAPGSITDYTLWVMDQSGQLVYDEDVSQIGKNLFEDPLYRPFPSLLDLGHRIVAERSGHGYYSYFQVAEGNKTEITEGNETEVTEGNKTEVNKECYWTTAGLHGRDWRIVVTKILQ